MSKDNPTPDELDSILQHSYGAYGVELPDWYANDPGCLKGFYEKTDNSKHPTGPQ